MEKNGCKFGKLKVLKVRLQPYQDKKYTTGEEIAFINEREQWKGPAKVLGIEDKTIHISHNGSL